MRLVTVNIGRKSSVAGVWSDIRKIRRAAPDAIVGWQEIDEADPAPEHSILRDVLADTNRLIGMRTKVPISVPRNKYTILQKGVVFAASGIPQVSPTRWIVEVVVQEKKNRKNKFVVMNMHYPAGAWNADKHERFEEGRKDAWEAMYRVHKARVKYWYDNGVTVFWVGDTNRMAMPSVHPQERKIVTAGIDSISLIPGNTKVLTRGTGIITLNSDHNGRYVDFDLPS